MQAKIKKIKVPFIDLPGIPNPKDALSALAELSLVKLETELWSDEKDAVSTDLVIAHNGDSILLKYSVSENDLVAKASTNGDIYEDSCVEFFVDLDNSGNYYNLEFNCLGWAKIAYGDSRESRALLKPDVVELISSHTTIDSSVKNGMKTFSWTIVLVIPIQVFSHTSLTSFTGVKAKANFYKCGDGLPKPHYLVWNLIEAEEPDFHRPEFFGAIEFE